MEQADTVIVGSGLAGLAAAAELGDRGKRVIIVDQEPPQHLGGQAFWSLGGLCMVDTPEQRRMRIRDSRTMALNDWMGSAQFDRDQDHWPRLWAQAYIDFASSDMRPWLHQMGMRWFPVVGWAERGGSAANGHGNSVPRFHVTWGTGPGVLAPFLRRVKEHENKGLIELRFRHKVDRIIMQNGIAKGISGKILRDDDAIRGASTNREQAGDFEVNAGSVIVTSGGIGGNFEMVRKNWPRERLGEPPQSMVSGVPDHVDGSMVPVAQAVGGHVINGDRMWHYTEGVKNWDPIWPNHGIRILPGPSSMWFDAEGNRFAPPAMPGFDSLGTLKAILATGYDYSWFILTQKIIEKEFALSGSEQNPDLTSAKWSEVLKARLGKGATPAVEAFKEKGEDFVVAHDLDTLVNGMNQVAGGHLLKAEKLRGQIQARDLQIDNPFSKDPQITAIRGARNYLGDRLIRTAKPHKILDPANGPLIAVKLHIVTRKSLGGFQTNLDSQMVDAKGNAIPGLFAAGEVAGFGGGGYHGYNSLEGTFLGGCIFSGMKAGRAAG
ncbi:MAG: FAD-binding dehydrogenase [Ahrensia sp.]